MFFCLPLDVDLKSQKFKKWREFLIITGLSFRKSTYKKCSPLENLTKNSKLYKNFKNTMDYI